MDSVCTPFVDRFSEAIASEWAKLAAGQDAQGVVIGAIIGSVAFLLKAALASLHKHKLDHELRAEALKALKLEVADTLNNLQGFADRKRIKKVMAQIYRKRGYLPYSPTVKLDFSIELIKGRYVSLSGELQQALLDYYYTDLFTTKMMDDFRTAEFRSSDMRRRLEYYKQYIRLTASHYASARRLLGAVDIELIGMRDKVELMRWSTISAIVLTTASFSLICPA